MRSQMQEKSVGSSVAKLFRNREVDSKLSVDKYDFLFLVQICRLKAKYYWCPSRTLIKNCFILKISPHSSPIYFGVSGVWYLIYLSLFSLHIYRFMYLCLGQNLP